MNFIIVVKMRETAINYQRVHCKWYLCTGTGNYCDPSSAVKFCDIKSKYSLFNENLSLLFYWNDYLNAQYKNGTREFNEDGLHCQRKKTFCHIIKALNGTILKKRPRIEALNEMEIQI